MKNGNDLGVVLPGLRCACACDFSGQKHARGQQAKEP